MGGVAAAAAGGLACSQLAMQQQWRRWVNASLPCSGGGGAGLRLGSARRPQQRLPASLPPSPACSNERVIFTAVMCRLAFIPAFHLAAVGGAGPAVLGLLTALLGTTNGWLTACAMMAGAAAAPPAAAELAGNLMVLFLILGLCIGAACGFLWLL